MDGSLNLASLLQSLDSDGDINNGVIVIDTVLAGLLSSNTDFTSATFRTDTEADLGITLVSQSDAQHRLNSNIEANGGTIPDGANIPIANAGVDQNIYTGTNVVLDGSASSDIDGRILNYTWTFTLKPTASTAILSNTTSMQPTFTADMDGVYVVSLVVNASSSYSIADTIKVTANSAPVADAGPDQIVYINSIVTLDGSNSHDPENSPLSYIWSIVSKPNLSNDLLDDNYIVNPTFTPSVEGNYTIELIVNDGEQNSTIDSVSIICESVTEVGGLINTNTIFTADNSPYLITEILQVDVNTTLTINAGVTILAREYKNNIQVFGTLNVEGTSSEYVILETIYISPRNISTERQAYINIDYAKFNGGGSPYSSPFNGVGSGHGVLNLKNSIINGYASMNIWYPHLNTNIENNIFINTSVISVLTDGGVVVTIKNNVFDNSLWIDARARYGTSEINIQYNTFIDSDTTMLQLSSQGTMTTATDNYWSTQDISKIDNRIYDNNDDLGLSGSIDYLPILTEADLNTPIYTP